MSTKKSEAELRLIARLNQLKRAGYLEGLEAAAQLAETGGSPTEIARSIRALKENHNEEDISSPDPDSFRLRPLRGQVDD